MSYTVTDDVIKVLLRAFSRDPDTAIQESGDAWALGVGPSISKRRARFSDGFGHALHAESHFYKRWFDFPETGQRGWAIVFQVFPPDEKRGPKAEYFAAWVPSEREHDADRWIEFLNGEIRARLAEAGQQTAT